MISVIVTYLNGTTSKIKNVKLRIKNEKYKMKN